MERLREHYLHVSPKKAQLFVEEVEFCGHVMRDGQRSPSTGTPLTSKFSFNIQDGKKSSTKGVSWKDDEI